MTLEKLGISSWPFDVVPPTSGTTRWTGRHDFKSNLDRVAGNWGFIPTSSIYLLWADFGAGKTHALRYMQGCADRNDPPAVTAYAEIPAGTTKFLDVYQEIFKGIPEQCLYRSINALRNVEGDGWLNATELNGDRDTPRVLWQLVSFPDDEIGELARRWLSGVKVSAAELRKLGGVAPVKDSNDALRMLTTLQHLITHYGGYSRLVLLLDEFQRVGQQSTNNRRDVNAGLHRFFNKCPINLTMFLSYSIGISDAIKQLITPELMSRIEEEMHLNMLTQPEAYKFMQETIAQTSLTGDAGPCIDGDAMMDVISKLHDDSQGKLTPRRLMQVFGTIFTAAGNAGTVQLPLDREFAMDVYRPPTADMHV